jgi:phospholipase/lecithinase/hemolysin
MNALRRLRWVVGILAVAWLWGCGGGSPDVPGSGSPAGAPTSKGSFTAVVSFGDSLSDAGAYAPATSLAGNGQAPYFGGRFTTNDDTTTTNLVWVEYLAAHLGIALTPAEVGFAGSSVKCPFAAVPQLANSCTAYGQGGALVTNANGYHHAAGLLTVPVKTQIANHLARFSSFKESDLILVFAGNNDVFVQFEAFAASAAQIQADAAAGRITPDQANTLLLNAELTVLGAMKQAALELAGYVRDEILAKGGKYVAVMTLVDIADTPFGNSAQVAPARSVLSALSENFNLWLREGLTDQPVQLIDAWSLFKDVYQNPGKYGIANNTVPACDAAKIQVVTGGAVTDGGSLFCSATAGAPYNGIRTGADIHTWFFADSVHPSTGGHMLFEQAVRAQLSAFGWI